MPDIPFVDFIQQGGLLAVVGILLILLWGGVREWWVFGRQYRRELLQAASEVDYFKEETRYWRDLALKGAHIAETAVKVVEQTVTPP